MATHWHKLEGYQNVSLSVESTEETFHVRFALESSLTNICTKDYCQWIFDADPWFMLLECTCFKVAVGKNLFHDKVFKPKILSNLNWWLIFLVGFCLFIIYTVVCTLNDFNCSIATALLSYRHTCTTLITSFFFHYFSNQNCFPDLSGI